MADNRDRDPQSDSGRHGPSGRLVAGMVIVVLLVVFVAQNTTSTEIRFLVPKVETPLWTALAVAMLLGGAAGGLIARHRGR